MVACGLFEAMGVAGCSYQIDPASAYVDYSENAYLVDYLQFPRQTLEYQSGDCDDLSILYASLLQAVGIDSAFITIPGHIYAAVRLQMSGQEVRSFFDKPEEVIVLGDTVWMPVEITLLDDGFVRAWKVGAQEWNENVVTGEARLIPIRAAWETYEAAFFDDESAAGASPIDVNVLLNRFTDELSRFVRSEIFARENTLMTRLTGQWDTRTANRLGVLYARFGLLDQAADQFSSIVDRDSRYAPAVINLATIAYLEGDYEASLDQYQRAALIDPADATIQLGIARAAHELGDYGVAETAFAAVRSEDPDLAAEFAYLELGSGDTGARASDLTDRGRAIWEEE